ncbi:MAG: trypsin-like serine protease [Gammaproteobacteria bacterium]|nr:trypsin-like serine protease [Gammaproteobacteria bacterium]
MLKSKYWNGLLLTLVVSGVSFPTYASDHSGFTPGSYNPSPAIVEPIPEIVYQPWQKSELKLDLPRLFASERADFQNDSVNGPQKIGIHRDIPFSMMGNIAPKLTWHRYKGGIVAYATISSPEAKSVRAQLDIILPANSELVFYGLDVQDERNALDSLSSTHKRLEEKRFWTPPAHGENIGIEIRLARSSEISKLQISLLKVGHRFRSTIGIDGPALELECDNHSDASCGVNNGVIDADTVDSTVKLTWEDADYSYLCSGVLMNVDDGPDVYRPYVLTAGHCISNESEANSLVVHWFYESTSCDSTTTSSEFTQTFGGADVLESRTEEDMTLLELERDAPEGAYFAGWTTSDVTFGTGVNGAHHPDGVLKKYFTGTSQGSQTVQVCYDEEQEDCFTLVEGIRVRLGEGAAEGGSSGSGLFEEVSGEEVLVGILSATNEGCTNQITFFGRFENFYPHITTWFDPIIDDTEPDDPDTPPEDDHGDTPESATVLALGEMTEGEIETSGDVDVFEITISRRGVLTVYTEGSTDTEGRIYNSDNTFEESDDDSGEGWNFQIEVNIEPGTYYIEVSGWDDSTGQYELYSSFVATDDHGDDQETATEISSSATSWNYDTPGKINIEDDVDVFEIETKHHSRITVYTEGSTDTVGSLKYENGELAEENDDSTVENKNFHISETFDSGIYYLFVEGRLEETEEDEEEDEDAGEYQLKVVITTE